MNSQHLFSILIFLLCFNGLEAQIKYEREYRVSKEEVPQLALDFIHAANLSEKVKWFKEEGHDGVSLEAKAKLNAKWYSIDFDPGGQIEDIEIDVDTKSLNETLRNSIATYLESNYKKSKIRKTQVQYVGSEANLLQVLKQAGKVEAIDIMTNYELTVNVKEKRSFRKMEFLFDEKGALIRKTKIVVKNTDNLEY